MKPFHTILLSCGLLSCTYERTEQLCGSVYDKKESVSYLVDLDLEVTYENIINKKSKTVIFAYPIEGKRNDTNFISSMINTIGDTINIKTFKLYNISQNEDSSITKYICKQDGIILYNELVYHKGEVVSEFRPNVYIDSLPD